MESWMRDRSTEATRARDKASSTRAREVKPSGRLLPCRKSPLIFFDLGDFLKICELARLSASYSPTGTLKFERLN